MISQRHADLLESLDPYILTIAADKVGMDKYSDNMITVILDTTEDLIYDEIEAIFKSIFKSVSISNFAITNSSNHYERKGVMSSWPAASTMLSEMKEDCRKFRMVESHYPNHYWSRSYAIPKAMAKKADLIPTLNKQRMIFGYFTMMYYKDMIVWNDIHFDDTSDAAQEKAITDKVWNALRLHDFDDTITENGRETLFIPKGDISIINDVIRTLDANGFDCSIDFYEGTGMARIGFVFYPDFKKQGAISSRQADLLHVLNGRTKVTVDIKATTWGTAIRGEVEITIKSNPDNSRVKEVTGWAFTGAWSDKLGGYAGSHSKDSIRLEKGSFPEDTLRDLINIAGQNLMKEFPTTMTGYQWSKDITTPATPGHYADDSRGIIKASMEFDFNTRDYAVKSKKADLIPAVKRYLSPTLYCQIEQGTTGESLNCWGINYTANMDEDMRDFGFKVIGNFVTKLGFKMDEHGYWRFGKSIYPEKPEDEYRKIEDAAMGASLTELGSFYAYLDFDMKTKTLSLQFIPKELGKRQADILPKIRKQNLIGKELWYAPDFSTQAGHFGRVIEVTDDRIVSQGGEAGDRHPSYWPLNMYKIHYIGPADKQNNVWLVNK